MPGFTVDRPSGDGKRLYRYELVSYRDKYGRPRHHQRYLGRVVELPNGRTRLVPKKVSREMHVEEILPFGDLALLWDTARTLNLVDIIDRIAPDRDGTPVGTALVVLALNHLTHRRALAEVGEWYERSMLRYWAGVDPALLTEKRLLGVLDAVCHQEEDLLRDKTWLISDAVSRKVEEIYGKPDRFVYYDRTQIVYVGEHCWWGEFGYGRDASPDRRKIGMGVVVRRRDGFPVLYRTYRGNQVDVTTVESVAERLQRSDLRGLIVVIDRGMASAGAIKRLVARGFRVLSGVKTSESVYGEVVSGFTDDAVERVENRVRRAGRTLFAVESVRSAGGKYVLYQDPRLRGELKQGLLRRVGEAEEGMEDLAGEVKAGGKRKGRQRPMAERVADVLGGVAALFEWRLDRQRLEWRVKDDALQERLRRLGRIVIHCTDAKVPKADLVHAYLDKDEVEKVWRLGKGGLGLVGVKHYKRDRVVAYLFVCYLAYLLWALVRHRLRATGFDMSVDKALDRLQRVEVVRLLRGKEEFLETPRPVAVENELCNRLGLLRWKRPTV